MNPHRARKAETDCSRVDDLSDGERAHKPWGQLPRLHPEWEVTCGQPNLLTRSIAWCRDPTAVGISLVPVGQTQESSTGPQPVAPTALDERLDRRDTGLSLLLREQWRLISPRALERRKPCCRAWKCIVSIFHPQKLFGPGGWCLGRDATQGSLHLLVHPFSLSVGLRMETRGKADRGPQQLAKVCPKTRSELWPPI